MKALNGKYLFGLVRVGPKGQIVIPKEARDIFSIVPGDSLMLVGDEKSGLAIITEAGLGQTMLSLFNDGDKGEDKQ